MANRWVLAKGAAFLMLLSPVLTDGHVLAQSPLDPLYAMGGFDGIGPGNPISTKYGSCTGAFLLRHPSEPQYFLSTAGHCMTGTDGGQTGGPRSENITPWVRVCYAGCGSIAAQEFVTLPGVEGNPQEPVQFATYGVSGLDFAMIRIPSSLNHLLRPELPRLGGPTDMDRAVPGDLVGYVGQGAVCNVACPRRPFPEQTRLGYLTEQGPTSYAVVGEAEPGDSGMSIVKVVRRPDGQLVGTSAIGFLTGPSRNPVADAVGIENGRAPPVDTPQFHGTTLEGGLAFVEPFVGFRPALVTAGTHIEVPPTARFDAPDAAPRKSLVQFDASASADSDGTLVSFEWDFGDGERGSGAFVEHTFQKNGDHRVSLTVSDDDDLTATAEANISILA